MFLRIFLAPAGVLVVLATAAQEQRSTPAAASTSAAVPDSQSDYVAPGRLRLALVHVPPGKFRMGTSEMILADDFWKECSSCPPRNDAERPIK